MLDRQSGSLNVLNPNDVYSVEVLRSGAYLAIYGSNASGGALVITMKHGGERSTYLEQTPSWIVTIKYGGFQKTKAFYQPKYQHQYDSQNDIRSTIYWNAIIL